MGLKSKSNKRAFELVEVKRYIITGVDALGKNIVDTETVMFIGAVVERFSGSRFEYFKEKGYNYPIELVMPKVDFDELWLGGKKIEVQSNLPDDGNIMKMRIMGDLIDGKEC